jgi:hypothetical protein
MGRQYAKYTDAIITFNSEVWSYKKKMNISLKEEIIYSIPAQLKPFEKDLRAMHRIKS